MNNKELAELIIGRLNKILKSDPEAIDELINTRVLCNNNLADHPMVQVREYPGDIGPTIGFLGLLNGLIGTTDDGRGIICAVYENGNDLVRFELTDDDKFETE